MMVFCDSYWCLIRKVEWMSYYDECWKRSRKSRREILSTNIRVNHTQKVAEGFYLDALFDHHEPMMELIWIVTGSYWLSIREVE